MGSVPGRPMNITIGLLMSLDSGGDDGVYGDWGRGGMGSGLRGSRFPGISISRESRLVPQGRRQSGIRSIRLAIRFVNTDVQDDRTVGRCVVVCASTEACVNHDA